jgi:hypothetical protein
MVAFQEVRDRALELLIGQRPYVPVAANTQ